MGRAMRIAILALTIAMVGLILGGCFGSSFLIDKEQEVEIGQQAAQEFDQEHRVDRTSDLARWFQRIGNRVAAAAQPPDYPYEFAIVREDVNNALAFPGGPIYMYEGLIDTLGRDEDQVAWVIGHEVTHVRQKHAIRRIESQVGAQLLIQWALGEGTGRDIAGLVAGLALQHYSRENEHEADKLGCRWAAGAGYDPTAAIPVLETFAEIAGDAPSDFEIIWLSHPAGDERVEAVKRYLERENLSGQYYRP